MPEIIEINDITIPELKPYTDTSELELKNSEIPRAVLDKKRRSFQNREEGSAFFETFRTPETLYGQKARGLASPTGGSKTPGSARRCGGSRGTAGDQRSPLRAQTDIGALHLPCARGLGCGIRRSPARRMPEGCLPLRGRCHPASSRKPGDGGSLKTGDADCHTSDSVTGSQ